MSKTTEKQGIKKPGAVTLDLQHFYVKEQSCKVPHGLAQLKSSEKPEINTEMHINRQALGKETYEVILQLNVVSKIENRTTYQVEVQQSCIFKTDGKDEKQLSHLFNIYIPNLLYPYARKVIADAVMNAGFSAVMLPPMDFASMYQQSQEQTEKNTLEANDKTHESKKAPIVKKTEQLESELASVH